MKLSCVLVALAGAVAVHGGGLTLSLVPIRNDKTPTKLIVPDQYIVRYKEGVDVGQRKSHEKTVDGKAKNASMKGIFDSFDIPGLQGYAVELPFFELDYLRECDLIDYIERDTLTTTTALPNPHHHKRTMVEQHGAPWGLARISHRHRNHSSPDTYHYSDSAGRGARVYVIDTGIRVSHQEFGGRAVWGANFIDGSPDTDEDGHGTHVAGVVAGRTYGVAKQATVVAVKVLDHSGTGSMSGLLQGLNWAVADAKKHGVSDKAVVNLSLTGAYTQSVNDGVKAATEAGLVVVSAAGNDHSNATEWSPASARTAITVGATDRNDQRAEFSNWGEGVDIFAPGVGVLSAFRGRDHANATMSGTSMATPHVAGLAAYFIAWEGLSGSAEVSKRILEVATHGVVGNRKGGENRMAYNDGGV